MTVTSVPLSYVPPEVLTAPPSEAAITNAYLGVGSGVGVGVTESFEQDRINTKRERSDDIRLISNGL